jgi:hypothetical protein
MFPAHTTSSTQWASRSMPYGRLGTPKKKNSKQPAQPRRISEGNALSKGQSHLLLARVLIFPEPRPPGVRSCFVPEGRAGYGPALLPARHSISFSANSRPDRRWRGEAVVVPEPVAGMPIHRTAGDHIHAAEGLALLVILPKHSRQRWNGWAAPELNIIWQQVSSRVVTSSSYRIQAENVCLSHLHSFYDY